MSSRRVTDLVSLGLLTGVFAPSLVDAVVASHGKKEQRSRSLPARLVAYFHKGYPFKSQFWIV